jgi:hypothetical protein
MLHNRTIDALPSAWLAKVYHRRLLEGTIRRTFTNWKGRFPRWVNAGFDEYFLLHDALPLLSDMLAGEQYSDPSRLAHQWVAAYSIPASRAQRAVAELTPIAADFIARLQVEYSAHPA